MKGQQARDCTCGDRHQQMARPIQVIQAYKITMQNPNDTEDKLPHLIQMD